MITCVTLQYNNSDPFSRVNPKSTCATHIHGAGVNGWVRYDQHVVQVEIQ